MIWTNFRTKGASGLFGMLKRYPIVILDSLYLYSIICELSMVFWLKAIYKPSHINFTRWSAFLVLFLIMPRYFNSAKAL